MFESKKKAYFEKEKEKMAMASETLDFSVCQEVRGAMHEGRLRMSSQSIVFKDTTTGRVSFLISEKLINKKVGHIRS